MIEGVVNADYVPVVTLTILSPTGQSQEIDAVVDTGFNGVLTLPPELVADLELAFASIGRANLADGNEAVFNNHGLTTLWDGQPRYIEASAVGDTPLLGMQLLAQHSLYMEVEPGGRMVIQSME